MEKKKDRVTATETTKPNKLKKNTQNNQIKCLLATSSGNLQAASIPSFLLLVGISEHRLAAAAAAFHAQKHTHTHTHTLSLSLSRCKLEFTTPWAPEEDLD
jgi:hypothetical protein